MPRPCAAGAVCGAPACACGHATTTVTSAAATIVPRRNVRPSPIIECCRTSRCMATSLSLTLRTFSVLRTLYFVLRTSYLLVSFRPVPLLSGRRGVGRQIRENGAAQLWGVERAKLLVEH